MRHDIPHALYDEDGYKDVVTMNCGESCCDISALYDSTDHAVCVDITVEELEASKHALYMRMLCVELHL